MVERTPVPRAATPVDHEVRVLYDAEALYVAVTMGLLPGETPRALELTRDSFRIWSDDAVTLKFDVHRDRRSTVGFVLNPAGAKIDFIALDNGASMRREYDAVWQGAAHVGERAWTAEFRIPAAALGLPGGEAARTLGFNVTRDHNARNATYDWSHLPPEMGAMTAARYGNLTGVRVQGAGTPVALIPYVLVGHPGDLADDQLRLRAGGDVRARLAEDVWGELTVFTDFAEVDLDEELVNLDRFPLFLPEKRAFFLRGLDVFDFGAPGAAQLFFSRRIGLAADGEPVDVYGGAKVYGRAGRVSLGLLDVVTAPDGAAPAVNHGVARARADIGSGTLGGIVVARTPFDGGTGSASGGVPGHYAGGLDGSLRAADDRLRLSTFGAATWTDTPASEPGFAARAAVAWLGPSWQPEVSILRVDRDFDPAMGFARRVDVIDSQAEVPWIHRWGGGALDRLTLSASGRLETTADAADRLGTEAGGSASLRLRSGWSFAVEAQATEEVVLEDFELVGVSVPAGTYAGGRAAISVDSPSTRNPNGGLGAVHDAGFFGGAQSGANAYLGVSFGAHVRVEGSTSVSWIDLPREDVVRALAAAGTLKITPTTTLTTDFAFQGNDVDETGAALARIRWRYLPGSDLFVVYRESLRFADGVASDERQVTLKLTFRYDAAL